MKSQTIKLIFITILTLGYGSVAAQDSYTELSFYSTKLTSHEAEELFTQKIQESLNSSTPKAANYAKLFLQYANDKHDSSLIIAATYQLGVVYYKTIQYDSSLVYISKAKKIALRANDSANLVPIYRTLGALELVNNKSGKSLEYFTTSYNYATRLNDSLGMAKALNNLSILSQNMGEYENALNYLKRALDLKIAFAPKPERITTLINIGNNYAKLKNYSKASEYYLLAEKIAVEFNEKQKLSEVLREWAIMEIAMNNFPEAEKDFTRSINVSISIRDYGQTALTHKKFAEYWMSQKEWKQAKMQLTFVLSEKKHFKDPALLSEINYDLGKIAFEQKQYSESENWLNKCIARAPKVNSQTVVDSYFLLSKIFYAKSEFDKGYNYLLQCMQIKDSINEEQKFQKLQELQVKYNAVNDKKQIDSLVELADLKEKEGQRSKLYFIISIIAFLITLIAAITLSFQVIAKRKKSKELEAQIKENLKKTQDLIEANTQAKEGLRVKSEFIAMVSHEIRTPMNAIIGMNSLLLDTELSEQQKNYLNNISISSNNLLILLNDILDFSSVESGKVNIKIQQANLKKEFDHIVDMFTPLAAEKELEFIVDIDQVIPNTVFVDAPRLRQVLVNLLSNAIKFTHKGYVKFRVEIIHKEPTLNGEKVSFRFSVSDTGIGVPQGKQGEIFSSFKQLDSKVSRQYSGVGLGLSISQGILGMMGSTIHLESEFAKGSTFWFDLSLKALTNNSTQGNITSNNTLVKFDKQLGVSFPLRILVAEDNEINQKLIQIYLNKMGYNPTIVGNGQEALDQIKRQDFDMIFMDVQMPVMDGVTATKEIVRKYGKNKPVIIAVTANAMGTDKQSYIQAGMDDYISKPYTNSEIESCLRTWYVYLNG